MMLLLVMVNHIPIFNIFTQLFYIVHPQTLDELSFVELIKGIIFIEVII